MGTANWSKGDEVKVTITGTVKGAGNSQHDYCHEVLDKNGLTHHLFLESSTMGGAASACKVELLKKAESFIVGRAYQDADGEVFIKTSSGWADGNRVGRGDTYPSRPMVLLEATSAVTADQISDALRLVARQRCVTLGPTTVAKMVDQLKHAGVKVTG